jgi:hypothetical protein
MSVHDVADSHVDLVPQAKILLKAVTPEIQISVLQPQIF